MIECWKCPMNAIDKCEKDTKYCKRYSVNVSESHTLKSREEVEKIKEKERKFWNIKNKGD